MSKPFEVGDAGQKLFRNMYGGTGNDNLITKRFVFESNCKFGKGNPQVHLIMIGELHKNTTYPILGNLSENSLLAVCSMPPTIKHGRINGFETQATQICYLIILLHITVSCSINLTEG